MKKAVPEMKETFAVRGFNPCESLLRHTPEQLRRFLRRMKTLDLNTIIIHYDYGWRHYRSLILEECRKAGVEITLMTFGPRTFFRCSEWKKEFSARREDGSFFTEKLECETQPCRFAPGALEAFEAGAAAWLAELPPEIHRVHMRAGDGLEFCRCPRCRTLPIQERWNPFVQRFVEAARKLRPDLKIETDVYICRYDLPEQPEVYEAMDRIMFDTFPRLPAFPLGSSEDVVTRGGMHNVYGAKSDSPELTSNTLLLQKLEAWNARFPGKLYVHENVMKQGLVGNFQYCTHSYLEDLETFRSLGLQGVCFEAFEPGYSAFAGLFETLSQAAGGKAPEHIPCELERMVREKRFYWVCDDPEFDLTPYISDPVLLKNHQFFQRYYLDGSLKFFRDYVSFALEHDDRLDVLYIGFWQSRYLLKNNKIRFRDLSPEAERMLQSRKLWDFMESLAEAEVEDPRALCRELVAELLCKAE